MSFRLFIYYCALCGGVGAFVGWVVGRALSTLLGLLAGTGQMVGDGVKAMCLGVLIALALSLVDALWVYSLRQVVSIGLRVVTAVVIGGLGGLFGGLLSSILLRGVESVSMHIPEKIHGLLAGATIVLGWTITGTLIGVSVGVFDVLSNVVRGKDVGAAVRKTLKGLVGGLLGGLLGGVLYLVLQKAWVRLFEGKPAEKLWTPSSWGFILLGLSIGLLIGLAQIILKEAWVRVEQGVRRGREMILSKGEITVGRAESCDIGLFGDPAVEKLHAKLLLQGGQYLVVDAGSASGTYVNEQRINGPRPLRSGDAIRMGKCVLRFGERQKRN